MNKYLSGNFGPVTEEVTLTSLDVTGTIPEHLDGRYVRIGPNPVAEVDPERYHWFMGDGMAHGIRIRDGRAQWYRNRWIRSAPVAAALGEPRRPGTPYAGMDFASNTNIIEQGGRTFAIVEAGARPYELTDELDTIGACDFDGTLPGGYTAHPHRDPGTGELHAVSYCFAWGKTVQYTVVDVEGHVRRRVDIPVTGAPMMHDFALSDDYVVIYDLPVTFDAGLALHDAPKPVRSVLSRLLGKRRIPDPLLAAMSRRGGSGGTSLPYTWDDDYPARVGLLPRTGDAGDVTWFDVDPCYVFHTLNAFQDGDDVVVDVVRHPAMFTADRTGPNARIDGQPALHRWTIDRAAGKVRDELVDDHPQEFPRIDERLTGQRHRYGYSVGTDNSDPTVAFSSPTLVRNDLVERRTDVHSFGKQRDASEFVFVPNSPDAAEDDGVLMGFVYDGDRDASDLVMLDAQTMESVATITLPVRVPHGFHGNWLPAR